MSDDCPCKAIPAAGDPKGHISASASGMSGATITVAPAPKKRRPKQLKGAFCVVSKKSGKAFNCSHSEEKARSLQKSLGDRFEVRGPGKRSRD